MEAYCVDRHDVNFKTPDEATLHPRCDTIPFFINVGSLAVYTVSSHIYRTPTQKAHAFVARTPAALHKMRRPRPKTDGFRIFARPSCTLNRGDVPSVGVSCSGL